MRKINQMYVMRGPRGRIFGYWFISRLQPQQWPVKGKNRIEVTLLRRDPDVAPARRAERRGVGDQVSAGQARRQRTGPEVLGSNETTVRLGIGSMMNRG